MLVYRGYHLQKFRPLTRAIKGEQFQLEAEVQQALGDHDDTTQYFKKGIQCMASQTKECFRVQCLFEHIKYIPVNYSHKDSVESPMMRQVLLVGLLRGCSSITFTLEYGYEDYCLLECNPV